MINFPFPSQPSTSRRMMALTLAAALLCPAAGSLLAPAAWAQSEASAGTAIQIPTVPPPATQIKTILLFPFASAISGSSNASGFDPNIVGARVEDAIKLRLNVIGHYKANSYSPALPQIQRALQESGVTGLSETDASPPFDSAAKGRKLADQVSTDGYLIGTIEAITTDPTTRSVSLTVSATLYNTATGTAVKALAYTGKGVSYNASDDPDALLQSAVNDAAGHVVSALNTTRPPESLPTPDSVRGHHSSSGSILLGILLASAVGIAISASHHSSSSNNSSSSSTSTGGGTTTGGTQTPPGAPSL